MVTVFMFALYVSCDFCLHSKLSFFSSQSEMKNTFLTHLDHFPDHSVHLFNTVCQKTFQ